MSACLGAERGLAKYNLSKNDHNLSKNNHLSCVRSVLLAKVGHPSRERALADLAKIDCLSRAQRA
jgi:hypothetical protein